MKRNTTRVLLAGLIASLILVQSCRSNTYRVVFDAVDRGRAIKPGSIAVIAGSGAGIDAQLAEAVREKLSLKTALEVLSLREVAAALPGNLIDVMEQFEKKDEKRQDPRILLPAEKTRISAVQRLLKTDYILAVWVTQVEKVRIVRLPAGFVHYCYRGNVHARLIDGPSREVLGYSRFLSENYVDRQTANYAAGSKNGEAVFLQELVGNSAERIVSRFARGYGRSLARKNIPQ